MSDKDEYPTPSQSYGRHHRRSYYRSRARKKGRDTFRFVTDKEASSSSESSGSEEASHVDFYADEPRPRAYAFKLARPDPSEATEEDESSDESVVVPRPRDVGPRRARTVSDVCESKYTGAREDGGLRAGEVTVLEGPQGSVKPLFRWIHFPWKDMDFDDFSDDVSRTPGLRPTERHALTDLLDEVNRKHIRSLQAPNGNPIRLMTPCSIQIQLPPDGIENSRASTPQTATWICLPYLSLEPYSGLDDGSRYPVPTLLQSLFSRAGRGRDMQQGVCRNKQAPQGHCFHVAQLWCIVIDNSLLFTCCRVPETTLYKNQIQRVLRPAQDITGGKLKMKILVCYRRSVMWSIPVEECETWLRFVAHFREIWPRRLVFIRHKRAITPEEWPKIWHTACRTTVNLELKIGRRPPPPKKGVLVRPQEEDATDQPNPAEPTAEGPPPKPNPTPTPQASAKTAGASPYTKSSSGFAIFTCLDGVSSTSDPFDSGTLETHLAAVHEYLLRETSFADQKRYKSCPEESRMALYRRLAARGLDTSDESQENPEESDDVSLGEMSDTRVEEQIDAFNTADVVFSFFLPTSAGISTAGKFWGAVEKIIWPPPGKHELSGSEKLYIEKSHPRQLRTDLRPLAATMTSFTDIFRHAGRDERSKIRVPDEILQAWICILMYLLYWDSNDSRGMHLLDDAASLLDEGLRAIVVAMSDRTLLGQAVLLPMELVSLMSLQLMKNAMPGLPSVTETYQSYLSAIDDEIYSKPSDRSHERHINFLNQEVGVVESVIAAQSTIFATLLRASHKSSMPHRLRGHQQHLRVVHRSADMGLRVETRKASRASSPNLPDIRYGDGGKLRLTGIEAGGFREFLIRACCVEVLEAEKVFDEVRYQAGQLMEYNRNKVDTTKDRQERAIYAFTIVTVIFLPLSAVSSIFGMNTVDIRDMELGQWAYWATAIPVTVGVIFLGLLFTGELRNLAVWALRMERDGAAGYDGEKPYDGTALGRGRGGDVGYNGGRPYDGTALGPRRGGDVGYDEGRPYRGTVADTVERRPFYGSRSRGRTEGNIRV